MIIVQTILGQTMRKGKQKYRDLVTSSIEFPKEK